jgi:hypothetical protein
MRPLTPTKVSHTVSIMGNSAAVIDLDAELDPRRKPWQRPDDLTRFGFGDRKVVYAAIRAGQIPSTRVGRKLLVPTQWVRRQLHLDDPRAANR